MFPSLAYLIILGFCQIPTLRNKGAANLERLENTASCKCKCCLIKSFIAIYCYTRLCIYLLIGLGVPVLLTLMIFLIDKFQLFKTLPEVGFYRCFLSSTGSLRLFTQLCYNQKNNTLTIQKIFHYL